jgi:hypothetical protein
MDMAAGDDFRNHSWCHSLAALREGRLNHGFDVNYILNQALRWQGCKGIRTDQWNRPLSHCGSLQRRKEIRKAARQQSGKELAVSRELVRAALPRLSKYSNFSVGHSAPESGFSNP